MKYLVLDLETEGRTVRDRFCDPLEPSHDIIMMQGKTQGRDAFYKYNGPEGISRDIDINLKDIQIIVGHNIKFDLLWLWGNKNIQEFLKRGGKIWDTMLADYLLEGQNKLLQYNLDVVSKRYGCEGKYDPVKDMYKGDKKLGIEPKTTNQIIDCLGLKEYTTYALTDVILTEHVYLQQLRRARKQGQLTLIQDIYLEHLLAVIEMEYNGLSVDIDVLKQRRKKLEATKAQVVEDIKKFVSISDWPSDKVEFDVNSSEHLSKLLYGGPFKIVEKVPCLNEKGEYIRYGEKAQKAGQIKYKNQQKEFYIKGYQIDTTDIEPKKKQGIFSTDDNTLKTFPEGKLFIKYRKLEKQIQFYNKYENCWNPYTKNIHGEYKVCVGYHSSSDTKSPPTGRLSSENPNVQNIPKAELGRCFNSRWKDKGTLLCFDFSQLEVYIQAFITKCPKLREDLNKGLDQHCLHAALALGIPYEEFYEGYINPEHPKHNEFKQKRTRPGKGITFAIQYGAYPATLVRNSGVTYEQAERVLKEKKQRYPEVQQYLAICKSFIEDNERTYPEEAPILMTDKRSIRKSKDIKKTTGWWTTCTGKRYTFEKKFMDTKRGVWGRYHEPSVLNFPIQGTATDLVNMMVGRLFRALQHHRDKILIINETHDDIKFDCKDEYLEWAINYIRDFFETTDKVYEELFGEKVDIGLKVDYDLGKTWLELKE
jgi:DNA polymerase I-like protein with 3'-5' exonuclease and polymerase domains